MSSLVPLAPSARRLVSLGELLVAPPGAGDAEADLLAAARRLSLTSLTATSGTAGLVPTPSQAGSSMTSRALPLLAVAAIDVIRRQGVQGVGMVQGGGGEFSRVV